MHDRMPKLFLVGVESPTAHLRLRLELSAGKPDDALLEIDKLVRSFVTAGERGGYPSPDSAANVSRLTLSAAPQIKGRQIVCDLQAEHVDPRAFQIVRIMIGASRSSAWTAGSVTIEEVRTGTLRRIDVPLPDDLNDEDVYPDVSNLVPFVVDWVSTQFSMSRRLLAAFRYPIQPEHVDGVAELVRIWGDLVEANGFSLPTEMPLEEVESVVGPVDQLDEFTIECVVDRFEACETAWNVLINLLDAYSRSMFRMSKISVE